MLRPRTPVAVVAFACLLSGSAIRSIALQPPGPHSGTLSPQRLEPQSNAGAVEFLAVGWPSALRIHGKGEGPQGRLIVAPDSVRGSVEFELSTLKTGIDLRDRHMKENHLDTARFPRATLTLSAVDVSKIPDATAFGPIAVPFRGTLSLHGVSRAVSGQATVKRKGANLETTATFSVKLADFGIDMPSYLGITVADQVEIKTSFSTTLERDSANACFARETLKGLYVLILNEATRSDLGAPGRLSYTYGAGLRWFPRPHVELQLRWRQRDREAVSPEYLDGVSGFVHFYP